MNHPINPLPALIVPVTVAWRPPQSPQLDLQGGCAWSAFPRLLDSVGWREGEIAPHAGVELRLTSRWIAPDILEVDGGFQGLCPGVCQRCLESMELPLVGEIHWTVSDRPLTGVHADRETMLCAEGAFALLAALEDDLLMALPPVPLHADPEICAHHNPALRDWGVLG